jgi:hypothetical protein
MPRMVFRAYDDFVSGPVKERSSVTPWSYRRRSMLFSFAFPFEPSMMLNSALPDHEDLMQRIARDLIDSYDEELELEIEDRNIDGLDPSSSIASAGSSAEKAARQAYFKELFRLQGELVKLQDWVQHSKQKVVILFEGRDAAGKGGVIKRITQRLNPRVARVAALPAPNDRERTQWYFQRYAAHLPAAGEMVLFDRSWYNRAGVERVMGFARTTSTRSSFAPCPSSRRCSCARASSSSSTGSPSPTTSSTCASWAASTIR